MKGKFMELKPNDLLLVYQLMKSEEENLSDAQYALYMRMQRQLYQFYTIEEMENINSQCGGHDVC